MNKKGYSHILDVVAGDQVPIDLDLAPNIMARIQKRKGLRMQPRTKLFLATGLVAILFVVFFYTVPGMAAAIGRWFGYVPGVGFVRQGEIRVLERPVSMTRDGVTVTIDQVVIDPEHTTLLYSVEGLPSTAIAADAKEQRCPYAVSLRVPDGSPLLATPNGIQSWASGYQHRFNFPPMPAGINDATLVIACLFNTRSDAAPENWEIPLHFVPAPPDVTAFPVIEITTPTASASSGNIGATSSPAPAGPAAASLSEQKPVSMSLAFDRAVQMDDGYQIYATVHWQDTPFASVDVTDPNETLHLLDANRQEMRYEFLYDDQTGVKIDQRQTVFAIKTAPVQVSGPLTLTLDSVLVELPVEGASFVFEPGPNPKTGQNWTLNQEVKIGQYSLRVEDATAEQGGYSFGLSSENGILSASLVDMEHPVASGGGGGGVGKPGESFFSAFNYASGRLPDGPVTVTVGSIGVRQVQRLEAQWTPPSMSLKPLPTQAAACLTTASWKAARAQKPPLPERIGGRVLASGQPNKPNNDKWALTISDLDGSNQQMIEDAEDGSFSPDSTKLAYSIYGQGISILDMATGQTAPIPGTANGDFNPIWSPDGKQIVFNRGMGVFDLFVIAPDGSNMRQVTHGGVQEFPVGWLQDGRLLYSVPGREDEYTIYQVDIQNVSAGQEADSEVYSSSNLSSISPDGRYILTNERTFGDRWLIYVSELDGANRWLLNDSGLWVLMPVWSPNGDWLLAGVSERDSGSTIGTLINLRTCQVIPLPNLKGNFLGWIP